MVGFYSRRGGISLSRGNFICNSLSCLYIAETQLDRGAFEQGTFTAGTSFSSGIQINKQQSVKRTTRHAQKLKIIGFFCEVPTISLFLGETAERLDVLCVVFLFSRSMRGALLSCKLPTDHPEEAGDELPVHTQLAR
jgi:hypothetical protein